MTAVDSSSIEKSSDHGLASTTPNGYLYLGLGHLSSSRLNIHLQFYLMQISPGNTWKPKMPVSQFTVRAIFFRRNTERTRTVSQDHPGFESWLLGQLCHTLCRFLSCHLLHCIEILRRSSSCHSILHGADLFEKY